MSTVTLVVSLPRSGTQRTAYLLNKVYGEAATVVHEPIRHNYLPTRYYRDYERVERQLERPEIAAHIDWIKKQDERPYIELSWQNYAAIPLFAKEFGDRLRVVHIYRHPVLNCFSLLTHRFNYPTALHRDESRDLLSPDRHRMLSTERAGHWADMTPYEKCLVYWLELNRYVNELRERYPEVPIIDVSAESLFNETSETLGRIAEFAGLDRRELQEADRKRRVDRFSSRAVMVADWRLIFDYPEVVACARSLGYDFEGITQEGLIARYGPRKYPRVKFAAYRVFAKHPKLFHLLRRSRDSLTKRGSVKTNRGFVES